MEQYLDENQNSDIGGTFTGTVTVEESGATPDINIIAAYIEQEDGTYEEASDIHKKDMYLTQKKVYAAMGQRLNGKIVN